MNTAAGLYAFCGQKRISKNCVHWAYNNPHDVFACPLHDEKVTVWCGITSMFFLGPYFFEEVTDGDLQIFFFFLQLSRGRTRFITVI